MTIDCVHFIGRRFSLGRLYGRTTRGVFPLESGFKHCASPVSVAPPILRSHLIISRIHTCERSDLRCALASPYNCCHALLVLFSEKPLVFIQDSVAPVLVERLVLHRRTITSTVSGYKPQARGEIQSGYHLRERSPRPLLQSFSFNLKRTITHSLIDDR